MASTTTTFIYILLLGLGYGFHSLGESLLKQSGLSHKLNLFYNVVGYLSNIFIFGLVGYLAIYYHWYWFLLGLSVFLIAFVVNGILTTLGALCLSSMDMYKRSFFLGHFFYLLSIITYCIGYYEILKLLL